MDPSLHGPATVIPALETHEKIYLSCANNEEISEHWSHASDIYFWLQGVPATLLHRYHPGLLTTISSMPCIANHPVHARDQSHHYILFLDCSW